MELFDKLIFQTFALGDTLCVALGRPVELGIAVKETKTGLGKVEARWAGIPPLEPTADMLVSKAPHVVLMKLAECMQANLAQSVEPVILSPDPIFPQTLGWMGGARALSVENPGLDITVAVSKLAEQHDCLLALCLLYNICIKGIALHHVGTRLSSQALYDVTFRQHPNCLERPASDHNRVYVKEGSFYREFQLFSEDLDKEGLPPIVSKHLDFMVLGENGAVEFLNFIAHAFGVEPIFWEPESQNDPVGMVMITAKDGAKLGVMARSRWWVVERG